MTDEEIRAAAMEIESALMDVKFKITRLYDRANKPNPAALPDAAAIDTSVAVAMDPRTMSPEMLTHLTHANGGCGVPLSGCSPPRATDARQVSDPCPDDRCNRCGHTRREHGHGEDMHCHDRNGDAWCDCRRFEQPYRQQPISSPVPDARLREILAMQDDTYDPDYRSVCTELLAARDTIVKLAADKLEFSNRWRQTSMLYNDAIKERDAAIATLRTYAETYTRAANDAAARAEKAERERDEAKAEAVEIIHDMKAERDSLRTQLAARPPHAWSDADVERMAREAWTATERGLGSTDVERMAREAWTSIGDDGPPSAAWCRQFARHILVHAPPTRASAAVDVDKLAREVFRLCTEPLSSYNAKRIVEHVRDAVLAAQALSPAVARLVEAARAVADTYAKHGPIAQLVAALAELDGAK